MRTEIVRLRLLLFLSCTAIAGLATLPAVADAPSRQPLFARLSERGPEFLTYDGGANFDRRQRDWPVSLVFAGHASVGKVKHALRGLGFTHRGIGFLPVFCGLFFDRLDHQRDRPIESRQDFGFWPGLGFGELAVAVPYVVRVRNSRADVVIQIAGHVEKEMADRIAVHERLLPDLFVAQRIDPAMRFVAHHRVVIGKIPRDDF